MKTIRRLAAAYDHRMSRKAEIPSLSEGRAMYVAQELIGHLRRELVSRRVSA